MNPTPALSAFLVERGHLLAVVVAELSGPVRAARRMPPPFRESCFVRCPRRPCGTGRVAHESPPACRKNTTAPR